LRSALPSLVTGVVVPDLIGMVVADAREAGHEAGVVVTAHDLDGPPLAALTWPDLWLVATQDPPPGDLVGRRSVVRVTFRRSGGEEAGVREPRLPSPDPPGLEAHARLDDVQRRPTAP